MLWQALMAARDLGRLHEIASILIRHGFGNMVRRMGLASALEQTGRVLHWHAAEEMAHLEPHARVRRALEELGPTFVKLGQILATRVDLFAPEWIAEFSKLEDNVPAAPYPTILQQLTEDLGAAPEEVFAAFDPQPLAAASIAQVHRARLKDGSEVVVKVRRPGILPIIESDLRWLSRLAEWAETESPELRYFRPQEVVRQFAQSLRHELDFTTECRNAERIAANFVGYSDPDSPHNPPVGDTAPALIVIPRVYWQWTGERVCVQEYIDGIPGRDLGAVDHAGLDRKILAHRGARAVMKMVIKDGLFHADPHPGNVFYLPGNRIAFIDFGMVGRLTAERRDQLVHLLLGLLQHDHTSVVDVLLDWTSDGVADESGLILSIQTFVEQYQGVPLKQLRFGTMFSEIVASLREHRLVLPPDLALLTKAFITLEGMGCELEPDFDMAGEALPLLRDEVAARYTPSALVKRGWRATSEMIGIIADLPHDLSRLLRAARRGKLDIHIDVTHLKHVGDQLDGAVNRLAGGLIIAALIVGSSIVMTIAGGPTLLGLPFFGVLGSFCATIGGIWLVRSIRRSNKADRERKP
jgi:ubiquinone biosynthesis protein